MSAEDDLARMVSAIVSDETADRATMLAGGVNLGTVWAGVYRGLTQGGVPAAAALEVLKVGIAAALQPRK
ncbi:hypothetical protein MYP14_05970 [Rhodococcus pyridinivorans]|uniref:hypothetical protein n=1 Tax=Rhodococcus pyridinivorans TaxID=103816 RepID=UPI001FFEA59A|nr:hypothetical protein [Rhodococcus pyridinivorans]UPK64896.1 hypothetical protein MYP14_05970 [Rhodococcus pyridinivorans]